MSMIDDLLKQVTLPPRIHATVLTDRDVVTGETLARPVVWADRTYTVCPQCQQPIGGRIDQCPVTLNGGARQGGRIEEWSQQHSCGMWLAVDWREVEVDLDNEDAATRIEQAARKLADERQSELAAERKRVRRSLRQDLRWALAALADPLEPGETPIERIEHVSRGARETWQQYEPGVYLDTAEGVWVAWEYDPEASDGGDTIVETVEVVTAAQAATMLGVSRQRVDSLAGSGKLERHPGGGVTVASVVARRHHA